MREKFWDLSGTKLGSLLKVANAAASNEMNEDKTQQKLLDTGEVDYKGNNQFASLLKDQK